MKVQRIETKQAPGAVTLDRGTVDMALRDGTMREVPWVRFTPDDCNSPVASPGPEPNLVEMTPSRDVLYMAFHHDRDSLPVILEPANMATYRVDCANQRSFHVLVRPEMIQPGFGFFGFSQKQESGNAYVYFFPWGVRHTEAVGKMPSADEVVDAKSLNPDPWSVDEDWDFMGENVSFQSDSPQKLRWQTNQIPVVAKMLQQQLAKAQRVDRDKVDTHRHINLMQMVNAIVQGVHALGGAEFQIETVDRNGICWIRFMVAGESVWSFPLRTELGQELVAIFQVLAKSSDVLDKEHQRRLRWQVNDELIQLRLSFAAQAEGDQVRLSVAAND